MTGNESTVCYFIYQPVCTNVYPDRSFRTMKYPNELIFDATSLLETVCPESILIIGESIHNIADNYQEQCKLIQKKCDITQLKASTKVNNAAFSQRYDLAIVSNCIELDNKTQTEQLIGRLRDLCAPKIILLGNLKLSSWKENDLLGFGLSKLSTNEDNKSSDFILYQYNIESYKRTPDWFNPKHWANPQLWNKFWW